MDQCAVYMLASRTRVLYIGVTARFPARIGEHKLHVVRGFTNRYNVDQLVWFEAHESITVAIEREKQLKRWSRAKKVWLIERMNPSWRDLYDDVTF